MCSITKRHRKNFLFLKFRNARAIKPKLRQSCIKLFGVSQPCTDSFGQNVFQLWRGSSGDEGSNEGEGIVVEVGLVVGASVWGAG